MPAIPETLDMNAPQRVLPPRTAALGKSEGWLDIDYIPPCNLTGAISPLFSQGKIRTGLFQKLPDDVYTRLTPALQLATLWMNLPATLSWQEKTFFNKPARDTESGKLHLTESQHETQPASDTNTPILKALNKTTFIFLSTLNPVTQPLTDPFTKGSKSAAYTSAQCKHGDVVDYSMIVFHPSWANFLTNKWATANECERMCFLFSFAKVLVHEFSHAVGQLSPWGTSGAREPLHSLTEPRAELGESWEYAVFGGLPREISGSAVCSRAMVLMEWRSVSKPHKDAKLRGNGVRMLKTLWLALWFRQEVHDLVVEVGSVGFMNELAKYELQDVADVGPEFCESDGFSEALAWAMQKDADETSS